MGCDNGSILDECQFRLLSETVSTPFASFVRREEMKVCPVRTNEAAAVVWCACAVLVGTDVVCCHPPWARPPPYIYLR